MYITARRNWGEDEKVGSRVRTGQGELEMAHPGLLCEAKVTPLSLGRVSLREEHQKPAISTWGVSRSFYIHVLILQFLRKGVNYGNEILVPWEE